MKTEQQVRDVLEALENGTYQADASPEWKAGAKAVLRWILNAED